MTPQIVLSGLGFDSPKHKMPDLVIANQKRGIHINQERNEMEVK